MAIYFKTKTGGQSEPTQDINVESPDNTVNISQSRSSKEEKIFDLSIKDKIEVKGVDGGAVAVEKSFNGSTGVTTFEISANNATEQNDGFLRAVGKYQIDHAQLIETEEQAESANDAAISLIQKDSEYFPVDGQMMTWKDSEGKLHLSRYEESPSVFDYPKKNWISAICTNDGYIVVLSKTGDRTQTDAGDFLITRSADGFKWQTVRVEDSYENWGNLFYFSDDDRIIALSRNRSQELMISTDNGETWTKKTLPQQLYWNNIWKDWNGNYVFLAYFNSITTIYKTSDFTNYSECGNEYPNNIKVVKKITPGVETTTGWIGITKEDNSHVNKLTERRNNSWTTERELENSYQTFNIIYEYNIKNILNESNVKLTLFIEGDFSTPSVGFFIEYNERSKYFLMPFYFNNFYFPVNCEFTTNFDNLIITFLSSNSNGLFIEKFENQFGNLIKTQSIQISEISYKHIAYITGGDKIRLFLTGGVFLTGGGGQSDDNTLIEIDTTTAHAYFIPPDNWREIPLINDKEEGFLFAQGGQAKTANLGDFLAKEDIDGGTVLKTVHSDRTTEYSNYRMLSAQGNVIWVQVAPVSMVDNTTKVYSDESCTAEIGIVTAHSYNPNNPNDVTVMIDGESFVYVFQESKTPQSLATTAALISAIQDTIKEIDVSIEFDGSNFSFDDISQIEYIKSVFLTGKFDMIPSLIIYNGSNLLSICVLINIYVTDDYKFNLVYKSFRTLLTGTFTLSIDILSSNHTINFTPE